MKHCGQTKPRMERIDGEFSRVRLIEAGQRLFAEHGFADTSIRQIALEAGTNISAISYYFGDKTGLYREVFFQAFSLLAEDESIPDAREADITTILTWVFDHFLTPLKCDETLRWRIKLYRRELITPSGLWQEVVSQSCQPVHELLVSGLCRHLKLAAPDDAVRRLAVCITGLAAHLFVNQEVVEVLAPDLVATPQAVDAWGERFHLYAQAMITAEAQRRSDAASPPTTHHVHGPRSSPRSCQ